VSNSFEVITFDPKYRETFRALNLAWIEKYFEIEAKDREQTDNPEQIIADGGEVFFAVTDGRAVGTCAIIRVDDRTFEIAKMAVEPESRGRGIGHLLMRASEEAASARGASRVLILSNTVLEPAIELYKAHGYQTIHLGAHPNYKRCNIEMEKSF
jgi:putative acetyltransferase